jgi:hypothetical protein
MKIEVKQYLEQEVLLGYARKSLETIVETISPATSIE